MTAARADDATCRLRDDAPRIQLSLGLPAPTTREQKLWLLAVGPADLPRLRRALDEGNCVLIDARFGRVPIDRFDLVLLRIGDDRFVPYGCAGPLADYPTEAWTARLAALTARSPQTGHDLLCIVPGQPPDTPHPLPATPIEELIRLLRARPSVLPPRVRLDLCRKAIGNLGDGQDLLAAVLRVQAARLSRLAEPHAEVADAEPISLPPSARSLPWLARARDRHAPAREPVVRTLFGADVPTPTGRDMRYGAFRVSAISTPLACGAAHRDFSRFGGYGPVAIDEATLAATIDDVTSYRILADCRRLSGARIAVTVDYEVRHRFARLAQGPVASDLFQLRILAPSGHPIGGVKRLRRGEAWHIDVPEGWTTPRGIGGDVSFTDGTRGWARQALHLPA